jgi:ABC-type dipeptide/oligopeptide/nickel transport system permease component
VIQAFIIFIGLVTVGINLIVDVLYTVVDPRVRLA